MFFNLLLAFSMHIHGFGLLKLVVTMVVNLSTHGHGLTMVVSFLEPWQGLGWGWHYESVMVWTWLWMALWVFKDPRSSHHGLDLVMGGIMVAKVMAMSFNDHNNGLVVYVFMRLMTTWPWLNCFLFFEKTILGFT